MPIIKTFKTSIDNKDHAMQVLILNLLRVIFFHSNFDKDTYKARCEKIYNYDIFINCIIQGMKNEVSFVRFHFIKFTTDIVPAIVSNV